MSQQDPRRILSEVSDYYTDKIRTHGATPRGVDWRDEGGQNQRFAQLLRLVDASGALSIAEIGCGYGALVDYLAASGRPFSYVGCDIAPDMVAAAQERHRQTTNAAFIVGAEPPEPVDYVVASGIFNVRFSHDEAAWTAFVHASLDTMAAKARRGFAFNALTGFSDADRKESRLWYPDPGALLNHCIGRYGRNVALLHDYQMYEFTVFVRTDRS